MTTEWDRPPTPPVAREHEDKTAENLALRRQCLLVALSGSTAGTCYPLPDETFIGSDPSATISLSETDLASHHVRLRRAEDGLFVLEDVSAGKKTWVNGQRVNSARLKPDDQIQLGGSTRFVFVVSADYALAPAPDKSLGAEGRSVAGLTHDFNNLMTAILTDVELVRQRLQNGETSRPEVTLECLQDIETAARRAAELARELHHLGLPPAAGASPATATDLAAQRASAGPGLEPRPEGVTPPQSTVDPKSETTAKTLLPHPRPRSLTILLVEDVELQRSAAARLLEGLGHRVLEARDGKEAIELFLAHRQEISLVLLDLLLPSLSGRDTFRWLRKIDPRAKIILTSGHVAESRSVELLAEGALAFLPKPYDREALERALEQAAGAGPGPVAPPGS